MLAADHHSAGRLFQERAALAFRAHTQAAGASDPGLGDDAHAICRLFGEFGEVGKPEIKRFEQLFDPIVTFLVTSAVLGHERQV
jgi:hypothetical protein